MRSPRLCRAAAILALAAFPQGTTRATPDTQTRKPLALGQVFETRSASVDVRLATATLLPPMAEPLVPAFPSSAVHAALTPTYRRDESRFAERQDLRPAETSLEPAAAGMAPTLFLRTDLRAPEPFARTLAVIVPGCACTVSLDPGAVDLGRPVHGGVLPHEEDMQQPQTALTIAWTF